MKKILFVTLLSVISSTTSLTEEPFSLEVQKPYELQEEQNTTSKILFWLPNRILDFFDIFHADVGMGPSFGGVVRVSRYVQAGYRTFSPASLRIGAFGRRAPFTVETTNEIGISPAFKQSFDRKICNGEVGVGLDLLLFGAYGGICIDEAVDFLGGLFFLDLLKDDY